MFTWASSVLLPSSPRLARVAHDNCLPCTTALLQGFKGFPSQTETLFSPEFTCSQQARELVKGEKFVSSGNAEFGFQINKDVKIDVEPVGALLFDVSYFSLQSGIKTEQHLRSARVTPTPSVHKIRRQFVCHCLELDPSAAQHSSDPLTGVRHCLPGSLLLRADMQTNTSPAGRTHLEKNVLAPAYWQSGWIHTYTVM